MESKAVAIKKVLKGVKKLQKYDISLVPSNHMKTGFEKLVKASSRYLSLNKQHFDLVQEEKRLLLDQKRLIKKMARIDDRLNSINRQKMKLVGRINYIENSLIGYGIEYFKKLSKYKNYIERKVGVDDIDTSQIKKAFDEYNVTAYPGSFQSLEDELWVQRVIDKLGLDMDPPEFIRWAIENNHL